MLYHSFLPFFNSFSCFVHYIDLRCSFISMLLMLSLRSDVKECVLRYRLCWTIEPFIVDLVLTLMPEEGLHNQTILRKLLVTDECKSFILPNPCHSRDTRVFFYWKKYSCKQCHTIKFIFWYLQPDTVVQVLSEYWQEKITEQREIKIDPWIKKNSKQVVRFGNNRCKF